MITINTDNFVRITVLDISGLYTQIQDEATLPSDKVQEFLDKYKDDKYVCLRT